MQRDKLISILFNSFTGIRHFCSNYQLTEIKITSSRLCLSRLNRPDADQSVPAGEEEERDVREGGGGGMFTTLTTE